ncbi:MAG: hypothetical protein JO170_06965 [Verrucomicrobia bacterium]|nr:hypothetical protein [Verrucomicrobiota bacterium]
MYGSGIQVGPPARDAIWTAPGAARCLKRPRPKYRKRQAPGTSFKPYPIPVLAKPKKIIRALAQLQDLKSFHSADAVNTTTGPQLPKYVSHAFGSLDQPWKPGHLRSAYAAVCCHLFKPPNQTDDIFLAQILGHKLLGPNASLSIGQSYKDFYVNVAR